jgi:hypothetical protein
MKDSLAKHFFRSALVAVGLAVGLPVLSFGANESSASPVQPAPCSGKSLSAGLVGSNGAGGTSFYDIALINVGRTSCRLSGYPKIEGTKGDETHELPTVHENVADLNIAPTILAPRMAGEIVLATDSECNALNSGGRVKITKAIAANTYTFLTFDLPDSAGSVIVQGLSLDVACGLGISQLGWKRG